jgi:hypothetical protein
MLRTDTVARTIRNDCPTSTEIAGSRAPKKQKPLKNQRLSLIQLPGNATGRQNRDHSRPIINAERKSLNRCRISLPL